jgi:predicted CXXCH cytochrome family protein
MTFIVRQISKTADGREIIRAVTHDKDQITVGRDSGNDIHLPDLAVDSHHAKISRSETGNRVSVEAVGTLGFDADGRSVMRVELDPAVGAELRFGSHRLTVGSDDGKTLITVQRFGTVSDSTDEKDVTTLFTLKGLVPGRRLAAWSLIAAVLALFLAWPISSYVSAQGQKTRDAGFHADTMWSSGKLSVAHQSLSNNCQACHVKKFESVTDATCKTCHKDVNDHADHAKLARAKEAPGMGGSIKASFKSAFGVPEGGCVECHTEHEGAEAMPRTAQAFCTDCHASLDKRVTETKLANASDFGTGHPQLQAWVTSNPGGAKRETQRVTLAGNVYEDNGLKFTHDQHLSSNNSVARMVRTMQGDQGWGSALECKDCHEASADGTRFKPVEMEQSCAMCHNLAFDEIGGTLRTLRHGQPAQVEADIRAVYRSTLPDRPFNLSGMARRRPGNYVETETRQDYIIGARAWPGRADEAVRAVFTQGGACYDCHTVTQTASGWQVKKIFQPARYMEKGWFDHKAHKGEDCSSCHNAKASNKATDLLLPDLASCRTCHVGENGASLKSVKTPVESGCSMCHDYHIGAEAPWKSQQENQSGTAQRRFVPDGHGTK